jgi:predicted ATPase/DNA-binding CsgD family transcriptional regulator/class 3 adenylate cyclase
MGVLLDTMPAVSTTFLFAEPADSLQLWEQHPKEMEASLPRFRQILQHATAAKHGLIFNQFIDIVHAAFQSAPDAVLAALEAQRRLLAEVWGYPMQPRLALLTGSAQRDGSGFLGQAPHRAARLLSVAHPGQVLLCHITADLMRDSLPEGVTLLDLGEHRLPDLTRSERVFQLYAPGLPDNFPPLKSLGNQVTNLPIQPYPLVGRQVELQVINKLLRSEEVRLLTLTGTGGTGKTRLALQSAADLLGVFPDGVFFVALDQIAEPALVASSVAQNISLELTGSQSIEDELTEHLRKRNVLLVLDNFEHVLPVASLVSSLLAACPQLKVIATSREPLRLRGEREFPVSHLPLPPPGQVLEVDQLTQFSSVALFIQRAQAARPSFAVDSQNATAVAEISIFLDGLPLAIELVAAGMRMFSPQALLANLKAQPSWHLHLVGPRDLPIRQQTLQKAIEWSYNLLNDEEQALFRRLGVFTGSFTLEAVEAVCTPAAKLQDHVPETLASLVEKNLVRKNEDEISDSRFSLLYIMHQFALGILERSQELQFYRQSHAAYFISLAEQIEPDDPIQLVSPGQITPEILSSVRIEEENLRTALQWSLDNNYLELALRFINALDQYWFARSSFQEALYWEDTVIVKSSGLKSLRRAKALRNSALIMSTINPVQFGDKIEAYLAESYQLYKTLDQPLGACIILWFQSFFEWSRGDTKKSIELLHKSMNNAKKLGEKYLYTRIGNSLAWTLMVIGEFNDAKTIVLESSLRSQEIGDKFEYARSANTLGWINFQQGSIEEAIRYAREALHSYRIFVPMGVEVMDILYLLAGLSTRLGMYRNGATMCGFANKMGENLIASENPDHQFYFRIAEMVRKQTDEQSWADNYNLGVNLPVEAAAEFAQENLDALYFELANRRRTADIKVSKPVFPAGMTAREVEILRLLSQGLMDAQIAETLFISPRTVNAHLTSIYSKLGVKSRAAATRFAVENGLA